MNLDNQLARLDKIDTVILSNLIQNSRVSFTDIAQDLQVAAGTIHVRVSKLMDAGIIKRHTLEIDFLEIGYEVSAFFGIIYDFKKGSEYDFKEDIKKNYPNILELHSTSGKYKFYGKAMALNLPSLNKIFDEIRTKEGVVQLEEFVCMDNHFCDHNRLVEIICKEDEMSKLNKPDAQLNFLKKEIASKEEELTKLKLKTQNKSTTKQIEKLNEELKSLHLKVSKLKKD